MDDRATGPAPETLLRQKSALRLTVRAARRAIGPEERLAAARALAERALLLPGIARAPAVMLYGASPEEADPGVLEAALRRRGTRIAYPRVAGAYELAVHWVDTRDVLTAGSFGLAEPTAAAPLAACEEITVVVVPGIAFDARGNRLGFGGGYYDRLLAAWEPAPLTVGFAYDEQVVEHVPAAAHDRPVDVVVTPTRTIRTLTTRT